MPDSRLLIIGLDGGTFDILKPLAEQRRINFFRELMERGVHGVLRSTMPPVTAPAWTTFMTGKNPGKHGLFDFTRIDPNSGDLNLTYATDCQSATIWDYLSEAGLRLLLVNIPMTFPPSPVNGVLVAGFPVPRNSTFVYPPDKQDFLVGLGYVSDWTELIPRNKFKPKGHILREVERLRVDAFAKLMETEQWDVAMLVISGTDAISHLEWQKGNTAAVEDYYEYIDSLFDNLKSRGFFDNVSIAVISDHGFIGSQYLFYLNAWLEHNAYLEYAPQITAHYDTFIAERQKYVYGKTHFLSSVLRRLGLNRDSLKDFGKKTGLLKLEKYIPHSIISFFPGQTRSPNWLRTQAYMTSNVSKGVNINLENREKHGIVSLNEYDRLRQEIVTKLRALRLPDGSELFEYVDTRENTYDGPFVNGAPDIVIWPNNKCNIRVGGKRESFLVQSTDAHHSMEGIFIFDGVDVRSGYTRDLSIQDVAPTLMHYLDVTCPDDMDGRIAVDIFEPKSGPALAEIKFCDPLDKRTSAEPCNTEDQSVAEQLRALGYL